MSIKRANRGDAVVEHLTAETWNTFVDTANGFQSRINVGLSPTSSPRESPAVTVLVRNSTGANQPIGAVLALDGPLVTPTANLSEFNSRVGFNGITPTASYHGKFVVLREATKNGELGLAALSGIVQAKVEISHTWLRRCDITPSSSAKLTAKPEGTAEIIWIETGTGTKNAIVRLACCRDAVVFGKPTASIAAGTTGTVKVWNAGAETTYTISNVNFNWMTGGQQISSGKQVMATWFSDELVWRITGAECEA